MIGYDFITLIAFYIRTSYSQRLFDYYKKKSFSNWI